MISSQELTALVASLRSSLERRSLTTYALLLSDLLAMTTIVDREGSSDVGLHAEALRDELLKAARAHAKHFDLMPVEKALASCRASDHVTFPGDLAVLH